ncbi:hypothetical protein [Methylobacterium sp. JK268]
MSYVSPIRETDNSQALHHDLECVPGSPLAGVLGKHAVALDLGVPARQSAEGRDETLEKAEQALSDVAHVQHGAGPSMRKRIRQAVRLAQAADVACEISTTVKMRLGQRAALARLMKAEVGGVVVDVTDRVHVYVDFITAFSANAAALTGSRWSSFLTWMRRHLPAVVACLGEARLKLMFGEHLDAARASLTDRINTGRPGYLTGPTPDDVAHALDLTVSQLRAARANKCGLTGIDAADVRRERDRLKKQAKRAARKAAKPTLTVEEKATRKREKAAARKRKGRAQKAAVTQNASPAPKEIERGDAKSVTSSAAEAPIATAGGADTSLATVATAATLVAEQEDASGTVAQTSPPSRYVMPSQETQDATYARLLAGADAARRELAECMHPEDEWRGWWAGQRRDREAA